MEIVFTQVDERVEVKCASGICVLGPELVHNGKSGCDVISGALAFEFVGIELIVLPLEVRFSVSGAVSDLNWDRLAFRFRGIIVIAFDFDDVVVVLLFDLSGGCDGARRFAFGWFEEFDRNAGVFGACCGT